MSVNIDELQRLHTVLREASERYNTAPMGCGDLSERLRMLNHARDRFDKAIEDAWPDVFAELTALRALLDALVEQHMAVQQIMRETVAAGPDEEISAGAYERLAGAFAQCAAMLKRHPLAGGAGAERFVIHND